jgi:peptidoglycan/xylan/chitin deacetylase (PgdA/CDA1 family)
MHLEYSNKIKINLMIVVIFFCITTVFFISIFKFNPYFTLRYAKMQFDFGLDSMSNIFVLNHKINASQEEAAGVPVLFYGGINNDANSVSPGHFKDQMVALKNAGFHTISLDDFYEYMQSGKPVPAKSFLLTFEDGRKDSYYEADPVLKSLGFKAVMFVIAENSLVEAHPFHLSRYELIQMRDTGRWDIQSHGGNTHSFHQISQEGEQGHFYDNKLWLSEQNRMESDAEFKSRISNDLASSKNNLEKLLGRPVYALGFPFDDRGEVKSNYPAARSIVQSEAEKTYKMVFNGFWPRSKDGFSADYPDKDNPGNLKRINVLPDWNGDELAQTVISSAYQKLPYSSETESKNGWINLSGQTKIEKNEIILLADKGNFNSYLDGSYLWQDYNFNMQIADFDAERTLSMMFRYHNADNYFSCDYRSNSVAIRRVADQKISIINEIKINDDYEIKKDTVLGVNVKDDDVACLIDNVPIISQSKAGLYKTGGVGLKIWDNKQTDNSTKLKYIKAYPSAEDWEALSVKAGPEVVYNFLDQGNLESADLMLDDIYRVERYKDAKIASPIDWRADPYHEEYWRFLFYSLQPTRHLMSAWQKTGNDVYKDKMIGVVTDFIDRGMDGPYSWDKHGAAYRTMVLVNTAGKLKKNNELSSELDKKITAALIRHGQFLAKSSNYQSDYNHGLDQAIALLVLSENYKNLPMANEWKSLAIRRLKIGFDAIIDKDGILVENSPYYHFYCLNKYWSLFRYLRNNQINIGENFSYSLESKIKAMITYGSYILEPDLSIPSVGASLAGKINNAGDYAEIANYDPQIRYVLTKGMEGKAPQKLSIYYPVAGQTIMRSGWFKSNEFENQTQVIFDAGKYRTNHSDLDALSFNLYGLGMDLLPDAGFYTYEENSYRKYFHGTRSHNTVVVDDKDQIMGTKEENEPGTLIEPFVSAGALITGEGYSGQSASHNLYKDVIHNRSIALIEDKMLIVVDDLYSDKEHKYDQMFHIFPGAKIKIKGSTVQAFATSTEHTLTIKQLMPNGIKTNYAYNKKNPIDGLCTAEYEKSIPCYSLAYTKKGKNVSFVTLIEIGSNIGNSAKFSGDKLIVKTKKGSYYINISHIAGKPRQIVMNKKFDASSLIVNENIVDDFSSIDDWQILENNSESGKIGINKNDYVKDGQSLEMIPAGDKSPLKITKKINLDLSKNNLYFKIKVNKWNNFNNIAVVLSGNNGENNAEYPINSDVYPAEYDGQWVSVSIAPGEKRKFELGNWSYSNPYFDWSRIDAISIRASLYEGLSGSIDLNHMATIPGQKEGIVVITFDDGWSSVMKAADIMKKFDMKGNVSVISGDVNKKAYMTVNELKKLQNEYGWNIVNHTFYHKNSVLYYKEGRMKDFENDFLDGFQFLSDNKINSAPNWLIYPNGMNNETVKKIVGKYYSFARSTQDVPEAMPFSDPLSIKVFSSYSDRTDKNDVMNAVSDAKNLKLTTFLMFHRLTDKTTGLEYTDFNSKDFEEVINFIKKQNIKVLTLSELDKINGVSPNQYVITKATPPRENINIYSIKAKTE